MIKRKEVLKMKNKGYKVVKVGSLVFLVLLLLWSFYMTLGGVKGEPTSKYEAFIKGEEEFITNYGCYSESKVEGLWCNDYPELANLDGNPEYSDTEKMITRSIQVHNSRISGLTFDANIIFWTLLLVTLLLALNLVMDLKYKK